MQDDTETLETIIDRNGVQKTLEMIAQICAEKADHIRASYDDSTTAASWRRDANKLLQRAALEN